MNRRISKGGFAALSLFYEIDRIPSFDIRYSLFDILPPVEDSLFKIFPSIKPAVVLVGGPPKAETLYETTVKSEPQNRRISNIEGWIRCAEPLLKWTEFLYSMFDVGRSMFDVH